MAAKGDLLLFSSIAKAFGNILSKDIEKEVVEEKKKKKKSKKDNKTDQNRPGRDVEEKQVIREGGNSLITYPNASTFSVFSHIRHFVLQNQLCNTFNSRIVPGKADISDSEDEGGTEAGKKEDLGKIPVMVGLGVKGVFVIIRDIRYSHPELCLKALTEFSNILCEQMPAALKEPKETTEPLFELLMTMVQESVSSEDPVSLQLASVVSACLLSLVVALGDAGKMLSAIAVMLTTPAGLGKTSVKIPQIFHTLQGSVQAVLLGGVIESDWNSHGVPTSSLIENWPLPLNSDLKNADSNGRVKPSFTGDGIHLYLHGAFGLLKIGTGYGNTEKGKIYQCVSDFMTECSAWIGFISDKLHFFPLGGDTISVINPDTLVVENSLELGAESLGSMCLFSDAEGLGQVLAKKEGGFVLRRYTGLCSPLTCVYEKPLLLSQKSLLGMGRARCDLQESPHTIYQDSTEQVARVLAAKNFIAVQTVNGKLLYTGSGVVFGVSGKDVPKGEWKVLDLPDKNVKVEHCCSDKSGTYSLIISDKGVAYFGGINKKGEAGEAAPRQQKLMKLKRVAKVKDHHIVGGACGAHCTYLISNDGKVFRFGSIEDELSDKSTGLLTDLVDIPASQVAVGRSHTCILSQHGKIYTFGNNLYGQCGRDFVPFNDIFEDEVDEDEDNNSDDDMDMCSSGEHKWERDVCMICKMCGYCTGYGPGCCNQGMPGRIPGNDCGCGSGDSGCKECGCCRVCAGDKDTWEGMFQVEDENVIMALQERLKKRREKGGKKKEKKENNMGLGLQLLFGNESAVDQEGSLVSSQVSVDEEKAETGEGSKVENPQPRPSTKKPSMVPLPDGGNGAIQVDCGASHTAVLLNSGEVYVFGSDNHGQLGQGLNKTKIFASPVKVPLPVSALQVACGENHTVILLSDQQVYTFGKFQEGQLGRSKEDGDGNDWHMIPRSVSGLDGRCKATWVGAQGNRTFIAVDEFLVSETSLRHCKVFSNNQALGLVPPSEENMRRPNFIMISHKTLRAKKFDDDEQQNLSDCAVYMDHVYNLLWTFSPQNCSLCCFNPLATTIKDPAGTILSSSICLPLSPMAHTSCSHLATNLLSCLGSLVSSPPLTIETLTGNSVHKFDKDGFNCVVRFNAHSGGWGYSASSVEAIRFSSDTDVVIGGFGLYGGRGTYNAEIKVYDIGEGGGDVEIEGTLMTSQTEIGYSCEKHQTYRVLFDKPVLVQSNHWYVVCASISSPSGSSSDAGSSGQSEISEQDKVCFKFKSSKRSNNGTVVSSGQIPEILYRIPTEEKDSGFNVQLLDKSFSNTVSADGLDAVLKLLEWSWSLLTCGPPSHNAQHLVFVAKTSLQLLQIYIQEAYPKQRKLSKQIKDCTELAEMVYRAQSLLRRILSSSLHHIHLSVVSMKKEGEGEVEVSSISQVVAACCCTFRACFHAFYPTTPLKWLSLCQHLQLLQPSDVVSGAPMENLLSAVLDALAEPDVSYIGLGYDKTIGIRAVTASFKDLVTVAQKSSTNQTAELSEENEDGELLCFSAVATKLLGIVTAPVRYALITKQTQVVESPIVSKAGRLLQSHINELAVCIAYPESAIMSGLPIFKSESKERVLESSVRFSTKEVGHPSLIVTGVAFSVNKNISLDGVTVYGGVDLSYSYKVNILKQDKVVASSDGTFTSADYYRDKFVNILLKNPAKLEAEVVYVARVEMQGSSFDVGVDGSMSFTGPGDVTFTLHQTTSEDCKSDVGPLAKFLYSLSPASGPQNVLQMSVHLSSTLLEVTVNFLQRVLNEDLSLDVLNLLGSSFLFSILLPTTLAQLGPVACKHPKFAVEVLDLVKQTLPVASAAAQTAVKVVQSRSALRDGADDGGSTPQTAEYSDIGLLHYATVETEHPYKQASVSHFKVKFSEKVQWMSLEFDPRTGFSQKIDQIGQLLIPRCPPFSSSSFSSSSSSSASSSSSSAMVSSGSSDIVSSSSMQMNKPLGNVTQQLMGVGLDDLYTDWERYSLDYPHGLVLLPGCEVHVVVYADTDYEKKESTNHFGLKCQVVGYEWTKQPTDCLLFLEKELATLGSMCAASLLKEDTVLPFAEELTVSAKNSEKSDMRIVQAAAEEVLKSHAHMLGRGLMVETPSIQQILSGNISVITDSNEQKFLQDFLESKSETPGGRLACWLQPDRAVNPKASELVFPNEPVKTGVVSVFTVCTKDQEGTLVYVEGMKVEVKAMWLGKKDESQVSLRDRMVDSVMGVRKPTFKRSYQPTRFNSNYLFHSISIMMAYSDYSFEELRLFSPKIEKSSESMPIKSNKDGSYVANWIPSVAGSYVVQIFIDGCNTGKDYSLEVSEPELELEEMSDAEESEVENVIDGENLPHTPTQGEPEGGGEDTSAMKFPKPMMKVFHGRTAPGLRIRSAPSLSSEQLGVIKPGDCFTYSEEIENESGRWVKLTSDAIVKLGCSETTSIAYALAFSQDKQKEFLEEKNPPDDLIQKMPRQLSSSSRRSYRSKRSSRTKRCGGSGNYQVIQCGSAGHNIRSKPGIRGTPVGRLAKGNKIEVSEEVENDDGIWLKLSKDIVSKYCDSDTTEAWTLAVGLSGRMFLAAEGDQSYLTQVADAKTSEAKKATSQFPTAASVFGTAQQSVFGTPITPPTFQFGASKPVKLMFGSQDSPSLLSQPISPKPFKFCYPSGDSVRTAGKSRDRGTDAKHQRHSSVRSVPKAGRLSGRMIGILRRRKEFRSPDESKSDSNQQVMSDQYTKDQDMKDQDMKDQDMKDEESSEDAIDIAMSAVNVEEGEEMREGTEKEAEFEDQKTPDFPTQVHSPPLAKQALSPAVAECQRAVFAAFLWQESLVYDAMASATFLKFHPEMTKELHEVMENEGERKSEREVNSSVEGDGESKASPVSGESECNKSSEVPQPVLPPTLGHLVMLWDEISVRVVESSSITLPIPKAPTLARELQNRYELEKKELEKRKKDKDKKVASPVGGGSTMCELCDQSYPDPITYHMKDMHPGCGKHANGWGYNSRGAFCSGWAGNCGDGGRGGSTWYLLCKDCHTRYTAMMKDDARKKAVKSAPLSKVKTKKPGKPRSLPVVSAVQGMIQNAKFLLEIARSSECAPTTPQLKSPSVCELMASELVRQVSSPLDIGPCSFPILVKSDSLPRETTSGIVGADQVDSVKSNLMEHGKHHVYVRSISEAIQSEPSQRALNEASDVEEGMVFMPRGTAQVESLTNLDSHLSSSLMVKPSRNLRQLIYKRSRSSPENKDMGYRRVMAFVLRYHDLDGLRASMKQSMRVAGIRAFAMEFLEWLLSKVVEPSVIHDILWQFNCALSNHPVEQMASKVKAAKLKEEVAKKDDKAVEVDDVFLNQHPLSGLDGAGIMLQRLRKQFHSFLRTTSNIMPKLPAGSAVQQEAMQCYYLQFQSQDHSFLLQSNVFSNISKALSLPEDSQAEGSRNFRDKEVDACMMEDILSRGKLKVSSNEAMSNSLVDKSTETFWESRDEPRAKSKLITITFDSVMEVFGACVHVDNQKDSGQRVDKLTLMVGRDEDSLKEAATTNLSVMHCGWKTLMVPLHLNQFSVVRIQVDGQQNKVRVRQVMLLAQPTKSMDSSYPAIVAQQKACEAEALRVFRSLTSQVFGGLLSAKPEESIDESDSAPPVEGGDKDGSKEGDVREHVVDILFSKGNLSGLQKQVCLHIVQSVHAEMLRMKDEWEVTCIKFPSSVPSKKISMGLSSVALSEDQDSDTYCYELLSMLLGLSQSDVGCGFLSEQSILVSDLFTLLHVASLRIQLQICSLLRKILPVVGPKNLGPMLHVHILPPLGYSAIAEAVNTAATINQLGLLDCLLAVISKALSVQVKAKGRSSNILHVLTGARNLTALTLANLVNPKAVPGESSIKTQRWYLKGSVPKELAGEVIKLLKDMIQGTMGSQWEGYAKSAVGQAVLHLTKISEEARMPVPGIYSQTLWLCLAALCVINKEHADALSSGQWLGQDGKPKSKPLCDNHDDGETEALILCNHCGNLCGECDRVLHYSRKNLKHQRQIFKEEEEAVKAELHEGCGRIKLYWTMALADYRTLKGMIEFKESGSGGGKGACRFCSSTVNTALNQVGYVCSDAECMGRAEEVCDRTLACGHPCSGLRGENDCLPCLYHDCAKDASKLKQDADDMCMICYTEGLSCAPCIQLECGHVFHYHCCHNALTKRWSGPRVTFRFMFCSICVNTPIGHPKLGDVLDLVNELYEDVKRKCRMRLEYENLMTCDAITSTTSKFYQKPLEYAMWKYAYYVCHKCKKAYYGGDANCAEQVSASDDYDPTELVCPACSNVGGVVQVCPKHSVDFLEYKCRYCCSVAVYFCFGTTHFCNPCHDDFQRLITIAKSELPQCPVGPGAKPLERPECPLHVKHPPTGEEFSLGCGVCRNAQTF